MANVLYLVSCPSIQVNPDRFIQFIFSHFQIPANAKKLTCSSEDGPMSFAGKFAEAIQVSSITQDFRWDRRHTSDFQRNEIRVPNLIPSANDFGVETEEEFGQRMSRICQVEFGCFSIVLTSQIVVNSACAMLQSRETNLALLAIEQESMYSLPKVKMAIKNEAYQSFPGLDYRKMPSVPVPYTGDPIWERRNAFVNEKVKKATNDVGDSFFQDMKEGIMKVVREALRVSQPQSQATSLPQVLQTVESRVAEEVHKTTVRMQRVYEEGIKAARDSMMKTIELVRGEFEVARNKLETAVSGLRKQQDAVLQLVMDLRKQVTAFKPPAEVELNKLLRKVTCYEDANRQVEDALLALQHMSKVGEKGYPVDIIDATAEETEELIHIKVNNKKPYALETVRLVLAREDRKPLISDVKLAPGINNLQFRSELVESEKSPIDILLVQGDKEVSLKYDTGIAYQDVEDHAVPPVRPVEEVKGLSRASSFIQKPDPQSRLPAVVNPSNPGNQSTVVKPSEKDRQTGPSGLESRKILGSNDQPSIKKPGVDPSTSIGGLRMAPQGLNPSSAPQQPKLPVQQLDSVAPKPDPALPKPRQPAGLGPAGLNRQMLSGNARPQDAKSLQQQKMDELVKMFGSELNEDKKEKLAQILNDPKNQGLSVNDLANIIFTDRTA